MHRAASSRLGRDSRRAQWWCSRRGRGGGRREGLSPPHAEPARPIRHARPWQRFDRVSCICPRPCAPRAPPQRAASVPMPMRMPVPRPISRRAASPALALPLSLHPTVCMGVGVGVGVPVVHRAPLGGALAVLCAVIHTLPFPFALSCTRPLGLSPLRPLLCAFPSRGLNHAAERSRKALALPRLHAAIAQYRGWSNVCSRSFIAHGNGFFASRHMIDCSLVPGTFLCVKGKQIQALFSADPGI